MNVREIRKQRNLTQADLAEMTGLSQATISFAEKGDGAASMSTYRRIADALNVSFESLFVASGNGRSALEDELVRIFRALPPDRQAGWIEMARFALKDHEK